MTAIERVLILGAGWVGRQTAARLARFGLTVWLADRDPQVCAGAVQWMRELPEFPADPTWVERVHIAAGLQELRAAGEPINLIIESVPEQVSLKKRVLREVSGVFPAPTIIVSNSSYFVPSMLSGYVSQPSRFAHLHFHVPVLEDSVVDIVGCAATDPVVIEQLRELTVRIGQIPLLLRREHPGYIFNWLLQSVLRSALELVELDVADPVDIDKSWTAVTGMPLGPFGIMDRIGLDVIEQVLSNARWADSAATEVPIEQLLKLLAKHTSAGELGVKSKRGFYDYSQS
jgi:3-hydroxybutyryl-CoA dehydrogenase